MREISPHCEERQKSAQMKEPWGAGEMAQRIGALTPLPEDPRSVPSTNMAAHSSISMGPAFLSSFLCVRSILTLWGEFCNASSLSVSQNSLRSIAGGALS